MNVATPDEIIVAPQALDLYKELGYEVRAFEMGKQLPTAGDMLIA